MRDIYPGYIGNVLFSLQFTQRGGGRIAVKRGHGVIYYATFLIFYYISRSAELALLRYFWLQFALYYSFLYFHYNSRSAILPEL